MFAIFFSILLGTQSAQDIANQRSRFDAEIASQRAFERRMFDEAGFIPLADMSARHREVRRILFQEGHFILPIPGVEIERHPSGEVTLTIIGAGVSSGPARVDPTVWSHLVAQDSIVFRNPVFVPRDPNAPIPPMPAGVCHPYLFRFAAAGPEGERTGSASAGCGETEMDRVRVALEIARIAVATRPDCRVEANDPFWSFSRCFTPREGPESESRAN